VGRVPARTQAGGRKGDESGSEGGNRDRIHKYITRVLPRGEQDSFLYIYIYIHIGDLGLKKEHTLNQHCLVYCSPGIEPGYIEGAY
jgi:hypothetical protein